MFGLGRSAQQQGVPSIRGFCCTLMMERLTPRGEKYVQRVAVEWLASHNADQARVRAVRTETETRVVAGSKLGSGRADGLVASLMDDGTVYTASL